jgi:hypothetical protein
LLVLAMSVAAFDFEAYEPTELAAVVPTTEPISDAKLHIYLDSSHPRYRTTARFTGRVRDLSEVKRTFVRYWVRAMQHLSEYEVLFLNEVEVEQSGRKWWLPIQRTLSEVFVQEVAPDTDVELFVLLMGAVNREAVFSISEFKAMPNPSLKRSANGRPPGPVFGSRHFPQPGPGILPLSPA